MLHILTPAERATAIADELPRELYEAYIASSGGLNYQGLPCPIWENLTEAVRQHWGAAARRARDLLVLTCGNTDGPGSCTRTPGHDGRHERDGLDWR